MRDYTLSSEKIAELKLLHRSLRDKHQADRVKAVIALAKGWRPSATEYQRGHEHRNHGADGPILRDY